MISPLFLMMRWVQTVPLSLLAFAAFQDRELRWGRVQSCLCSAAYMVLGSAAMAVLSPMSSLDGQRNIVARDLILALFLFVYFLGWIFSVRAPAVRKGLVAGLLLHYWMALQTLGDVFAALILREGYAAEVNAEAGSLTYNLCVLAATAATWPLVCFFLRSVLRKNLPMLDSREAKRGGVYLLAMFLLFSIATYNPHFESLPDTPLFVAALILTDMIAYYIFFQEIGVVQRQGETARQLERYRLQYRQISARVEEARRLRHDMRHHLNTLGALNAQGKQAEIGAYLRRYGTVYDRLEGPGFCGDLVVDSVLGYYLAQAEGEGIHVQCGVFLPGGCGVEPMDMTVLLGNCLENALEALRKIPQGERRLEIDLRTDGPVLLVQVANTCQGGGGTGEFAGWEGFASSKPGGGMGLRSITGIAEKYGGSARFRRAGGTFTLRVVLNVF